MVGCTATGATLSADSSDLDTIGVTNNAAAQDKTLDITWYNESNEVIDNSTKKATAVNPSVQELQDTSSAASAENVLGLHTYYYDTVASTAYRAKNDASLKKSAYAYFTIDTSQVASASYQGSYEIKVTTTASSKIRLNTSDTWTTAISTSNTVSLGFLIISDAGVVSYNTNSTGTGSAINPASKELKVFYAVEPITTTGTEDGSGSYGSLIVTLR